MPLLQLYLYADQSANRTITLPDATGTVALTGTTLAHYGITDAQASSPNLTSIAGLDALQVLVLANS